MNIKRKDWKKIKKLVKKLDQVHVYDEPNPGALFMDSDSEIFAKIQKGFKKTIKKVEDKEYER